MKKRLYTATSIDQLVHEQGQTTLVLSRSDILTPLARDRAQELGLEIVHSAAGSGAGASHPADDLPAWSGAAQKLRALAGGSSSGAGPPPAAHSAPASEGLEGQVRRIVASLLAQPQAEPSRPARPPAVVHVDSRSLTMPPFPFEIDRPHMDVRLEDVISHEHGSPIAAGFMSLHKGSFPWTLDYDEIEYVIEGELHIGSDRGVVVGRPGDVIYVPKGASITFGTPSWARFLYVTYPAQWSAT